MSDIKSKPDENGVYLCDCDNCPEEPRCEHAYRHICYPKVVEIVKAATAVANFKILVGNPNGASESRELNRLLREALSHE